MVRDQNEWATIKELVELAQGKHDCQCLFLDLAVPALRACEGLRGIGNRPFTAVWEAMKKDSS